METKSLTDTDRITFLRMLDKAVAEVEVTDWEAEFIESIFKNCPDSLTVKQRECVDVMIKKIRRKHRVLERTNYAKRIL